ncbi:MAG: aminotransferase class I/II-fold pyridoxal phosphate-dependent enzyme, partial [Fusobacteriaceae bacterium]
KYSGAPLVEKYPNLFLIRGTSKFFATPGIRLGYALVAQGELREKVEAHSNLWNINIFAVLMGEEMFNDREYIKVCRNKILKEREYLQEALNSLEGIKVYASTSNFILCQILKENFNSGNLREICLRDGMVIRDASKFSGLNEKFFRVCLLKSEDNKKLVNKLGEIFGKK